jgi:glucose-1-phosphate thymidylyltransferase
VEPARPQSWEVIGLVPAAGRARRIAPLPCSKELYPIGFQRMKGMEELRAKVVSYYLLEKFRDGRHYEGLYRLA